MAHFHWSQRPNTLQLSFSSTLPGETPQSRQPPNALSPAGHTKSIPKRMRTPPVTDMYQDCVNALNEIVHEILETRIKYHSKATFTQRIDWATTNLNLAGLPEHLHEETMSRILTPKRGLGKAHRNSRRRNNIDPIDMILIWLFTKKCANEAENEDKEWGRSIFQWLYGYGDFEDIGPIARANSKRAGQRTYRVEEETRRSNIEIWMWGVDGNAAVGTESLEDRLELLGLEHDESERMNWMDELKDIRFGEEYFTPRIIDMGNGWVRSENEGFIVWLLEGGRWKHRPQDNGLDAPTGWMDDQGWLWHADGSFHAAYQFDKPSICEICEDSKPVGEDVKEEWGMADWQRTWVSLQAPVSGPSHAKKIDEELRFYQETFCDTLHAFIACHIKWDTGVFGKNASITREMLNLLEGMPVQHIEETLTRLLGSDRKLGKYHETARENRESEKHPMVEVAYWLWGIPKEATGMVWFHEMFEWMYRVKVWERGNFDSCMGVCEKEILEAHEVRKELQVMTWLRDVKDVMPIRSQDDPIWLKCEEKRICSGSSRATRRLGDYHGSKPWHPERLLRYRKLWAEASNGVHRLWLVRLNESVNTRRLVSSEKGWVYWDHPGTRGEKRHVEEDSGWIRDRRIWVKKQNKYTTEPERWEVDDDDNNEDDIGWIGDDGWVHHRQRWLSENGWIWWRARFHAGNNSDGVIKCKKCVNVLTDD